MSFFLARFPYNPILYYAHSSLLKENNSANNRLPLGLSALFYKTEGDVFTSEFVPCFYFKLRSVSAAKKKKNICPPKRRLFFFFFFYLLTYLLIFLNNVGNVYLNKLCAVYLHFQRCAVPSNFDALSKSKIIKHAKKISAFTDTTIIYGVL